MSGEALNRYAERYGALQAQLPGRELPWLEALRRAALDQFGREGFPTPRNEAWKYTNVATIARQLFEPVVVAPSVDLEVLAALTLPGLDGSRMVFVDGVFAPELSRLDDLPEGVRVRSLTEALAEDPEGVQALLADLPEDGSGFAALNTAFMAGGAYVSVAPDCRTEQPLHLLYLASGGEQPRLASPRTLVRAGGGSHLTLVEEYLGLGEGRSLTNAQTRLRLGRDARVEYYRLNREGARAFHVGELRVSQEADSNLEAALISLGGLISRTDVRLEFRKPGAECRLNGLYVAGGRQHVDHHLHFDHRAPECTSEQFFKGVLTDAARAVFTGRVVVHPDAQHTDARQSNKNLLLSADAEVDTRPQLEIYADDVKCAHGATVGQLDADALFYLRARGVGEAEARGLLVHAFVDEVLQRMPLTRLRTALGELLAARLGGGEANP